MHLSETLDATSIIDQVENSIQRYRYISVASTTGWPKPGLSQYSKTFRKYCYHIRFLGNGIRELQLTSSSSRIHNQTKHAYRPYQQSTLPVGSLTHIPRGKVVNPFLQKNKYPCSKTQGINAVVPPNQRKVSGPVLRTPAKHQIS